MARTLNPNPATEAAPASFARWLHKSGSTETKAADLTKLPPPPSLIG